jgi:hypothetical protein
MGTDLEILILNSEVQLCLDLHLYLLGPTSDLWRFTSTPGEPYPLGPLDPDAAQKTFIDIADGTHEPTEVKKVLALTDNMPLAIDLLANLADMEGCSTVLSHWEEEKTSLISYGYDKRSNLDLSIALSLSSPWLNVLPQAKDLLSLSILPDGLSDADLIQSKLLLNNILG